MPSKGSAAGGPWSFLYISFLCHVFPRVPQKVGGGGGGGRGGEENSLSPASLENGSGQVLSQESWWAVLG